MDNVNIPLGPPLIVFDDTDGWKTPLKVGGTNLLNYTAFDYGIPEKQFYPNNCKLTYNKDDKSISGYSMNVSPSGTTEQMPTFGFIQSIESSKFVSNGVYTISFIAKAESAGALLRCNINDNLVTDIELTTEYIYVKKTFKLGPDPINVLSLFMFAAEGIAFDIADLKLEEGNVCTTWCKSPSDTTSSSNSNAYILGSVTSFGATPCNGKIKLSWKDPDDILINGTKVQWGGTVIVMNTENYPTSIDDGEIIVESTTRDQYLKTPYVVPDLTNGTVYYFKAFSYTIDGTYNNLNDCNIVEATPTADPVIYGVGIPTDFILKSDAFNTDSILFKYTDTNALYSPAEVAGSIIDYHEWTDIINKMIIGGICLFKDGKVNYYLDPNDLTKKINGEDADITSGKDGDVMVEFNKVSYALELINEENIMKFTITNHDSSFESSANYNKLFKNYSKMYVSAFDCCLLDGKLRSLYNKYPAYIKPVDISNYLNQGYRVINFNQYMYILLLRALILKYNGWTSNDGYSDKVLKSGDSLGSIKNKYGEITLFNLENFATNTQKLISDNPNVQGILANTIDYTGSFYMDKNSGFGHMMSSTDNKCVIGIKHRRSVDSLENTNRAISFGFNNNGSPTSDPNESFILYNIDDKNSLTKDIGYKLVYML